MVRNLMLVAALVGSVVFAGDTAQAFGKKGCGGKLFGNTSGCGGQVVNTSGCGTTTYSTPYPAATTWSQPATGAYTPYITPTTYSTPYPAATTGTITSNPTITSPTATIDGKTYTLTQTGVMSNGQPVYTITQPVTAIPKK